MHLAPVDVWELADTGAEARRAFRGRYVRCGVPVVLRGLASTWPALSRWTPDYFRERFGDRLVTVNSTRARGANFGGAYGARTVMTMREFLAAVLDGDQDLRLAARNTTELVPELAGDYALPALAERYLTGLTWLFFGARGSATPMHYDFKAVHVLHTVFGGRKTFTLFPADQARALHRLPLTPRSPVDPRRIDEARTPRAVDARGYRVTLEHGDTLLLPAGMWHHTSYDDPSIALTLRFADEQRLVAPRMLWQLGAAFVSHALDRAAPRAWPMLQERLAGARPAPTLSLPGRAAS